MQKQNLENKRLNVLHSATSQKCMAVTAIFSRLSIRAFVAKVPGVPLRIPDIKRPIGPVPPSTESANDNFKWGIREDAGFISMAPCSRLPSTRRWAYGGYISGFIDGIETPRFFCAQAVARASWNILNIIHTAQVEKRLCLPSEATLPSFGLWHGLKISFPP